MSEVHQGNGSGREEELREFKTGAVRSSDADHYDFASMPLLGLLGVARTSAEGAEKYGRFNYMKGMPAHDTINHVIRHLVLWLAGDRNEPHLEHAAWGCMAAAQSMVLDPKSNAAHLPAPGYLLTDEILEEMERTQKNRKAQRNKSRSWRLEGLPEVMQILWERSEAHEPTLEGD